MWRWQRRNKSRGSDSDGRPGCDGSKSLIFLAMCFADSNYKLYAALYEWRTREQQVAEFSANAYLDVYIGHVNTLKHIQDHHPGTFHLMMADIYIKAK